MCRSACKETIYTNQKHPFLTVEAGFVPVANLSLGMHVVRADGTARMVTGWKVVPGSSVMYNLEVAQDHTFVVGGGEWVVHNCSTGRSSAFRSAKRDAGIPMGQQPDEVRTAAMTNQDGSQVLNSRYQPVNTREYTFTRSDGKSIVIQDHSAGHQFGEGGIGDQGPHFNVRPIENTRTGSVEGTLEHYFLVISAYRGLRKL